MDIYDLLLFNIVRIPSLRSLGLSPADMGPLLLNWQMAGMLVGGILWGILGDKKGRRLLLFGSITLYSTATLANAFVHSFGAYAFWRVLAGIGLAGELGGSMALVSELLPRDLRGYGTMIVTTVGVFGAVVAGLTAKHLDWRTAYAVGGGLGFAPADVARRCRRIRDVPARAGARRGPARRFPEPVHELQPPAALPVLHPDRPAALVRRGHRRGVLSRVRHRPPYPRGRDGGRRGAVGVFGITVGDFLTGTLSQLLHSRKKVVALGLLVSSVFLWAYFSADGRSAAQFYAIIFGLGVGPGVLGGVRHDGGRAVRDQPARDDGHDGAELRARLVDPDQLDLPFALKGSHSALHAAAITGMICIPVAFPRSLGTAETYGVDLDYVELPEGSHF